MFIFFKCCSSHSVSCRCPQLSVHTLTCSRLVQLFQVFCFVSDHTVPLMNNANEAFGSASLFNASTAAYSRSFLFNPSSLSHTAFYLPQKSEFWEKKDATCELTAFRLYVRKARWMLLAALAHNPHFTAHDVTPASTETTDVEVEVHTTVDWTL